MEEAGADRQTLESYDGTGIRIVILDSGIHSSHEAFEGANILEGKNYLDAESENTKDFLGHGTMIASILAAQPGNNLHLQELVPLKCFDGEKASVSVLCEAIYDAVDEYNCDIIHMSWGLETPNEELKTAIEYAAGKGVFLVASCGNDGGSEAYYPASWEEVFSVGAADRNGMPAGFTQKSTDFVLLAPGTKIPGAGHTSDRALVNLTGTSYAVAYVTGAIALALQASPGITREELETALVQSARPVKPEDAAGCSQSGPTLTI